MPRKIRIRPSFANDHNYLTRLKQAIEKDMRLPAAMRSSALNQLSDLIILLIQADKLVKQLELEEESDDEEVDVAQGAEMG
jgi:hypothetical protein